MSAKKANDNSPGVDVACCEQAARVFKALGHPVRVAIIRCAMGEGMCVGELRECLDRNQPNISQHLSVLRECGLVVPERDGNRVRYRIADERVEGLCRSVEEIFGTDQSD